MGWLDALAITGNPVFSIWRNLTTSQDEQRNANIAGLSNFSGSPLSIIKGAYGYKASNKKTNKVLRHKTSKSSSARKPKQKLLYYKKKNH